MLSFEYEVRGHYFDVEILDFTPGVSFKQTGWGYGDCEPEEPDEVEIELHDCEIELTEPEWWALEAKAIEYAHKWWGYDY